MASETYQRGGTYPEDLFEEEWQEYTYLATFCIRNALVCVPWMPTVDIWTPCCQLVVSNALVPVFVSLFR